MKKSLLISLLSLSMAASAGGKHAGSHEETGSDHKEIAAHGAAEQKGHSGHMMNDMHGQGGHGEHMNGGHGASKAGEPGRSADVSKTIAVEASDQMQFKMANFKVKEGETVKFVVTNKGKIPHEFSLGTKGEHLAHQQEMMKMPSMQHDGEGPSVTVAPGETKELIWKFKKGSNIEAACNIPGHYQAGMHKRILMD